MIEPAPVWRSPEYDKDGRRGSAVSSSKRRAKLLSTGSENNPEILILH
jgi:hypothetical protein